MRMFGSHSAEKDELTRRIIFEIEIPFWIDLTISVTVNM